jgi:hypothetical protein
MYIAIHKDFDDALYHDPSISGLLDVLKINEEEPKDFLFYDAKPIKIEIIPASYRIISDDTLPDRSTYHGIPSGATVSAIHPGND